MRTRIGTTASVIVMAITGILMPAPAPAEAASTAALPDCQLFAEPPEFINASITGMGSWAGCSASTSITVVLRHDRSWWPDRTLASKSGTGGAGSLTVAYPCGNDFEPIKVFIETRRGSTHVQSERRVLPCG